MSTTIQDRRRRTDAAYAGQPAPPPAPRTSTLTAAQFGARLAAIPGDPPVEWLLELLRRSLVADKDERAFLTAYYGMPPAIHFVGFRGDEYTRACRVWGRPDFIHRSHDLRLVLGGELAPHDTVVFAGNHWRAVCLFSFNDSQEM